MKERIKFLETHTLAESLYNDGKTPKPQDVAQISTRKFYSYAYKDCYLLANLINISRKSPKVITDEIINILDDKNCVKLRFFTAGFFISDLNVAEFRGIEKKYYTVTKEEVMKLVSQTHHKALWPLVIEIAYAKHINKTHRSIDVSEHLAYIVNKSFECKPEHVLDEEATEKLLGLVYETNGNSALTNTELTGIKSRSIILKYILTDSFKKFPKNAQYNENAKMIYQIIEKAINKNQSVIVDFDKLTKRSGEKLMPSMSNHDIAVRLFGYLRNKSEFAEHILEHAFNKTPFEWYSENKNKYNIKPVNSDLLLVKNKKDTIYNNRFLSDEDLIKYISECLISEEVDSKIKPFLSKTKTGFFTKHAYAVVDCFEHEGYKYVVIQNPYDSVTKIDYSKSKKLPPEVKLPSEVDAKINFRNQCMMELNHFCKHLCDMYTDAEID